MRFFTVYGPFGRPDMAYFSFTQKIISGEKIKIYNNGDLYRDFTYIDDIIEAICKIMTKIPDNDRNGACHKVYNIGNSKPEKLVDFVNILEECIGKRANIVYLPMQQGDVYQTYADITELEHDFRFKPKTSIKEGLTNFVDWYRAYYDV